jgi:hypothetical protein
MPIRIRILIGIKLNIRIRIGIKRTPKHNTGGSTTFLKFKCIEKCLISAFTSQNINFSFKIIFYV